MQLLLSHAYNCELLQVLDNKPPQMESSVWQCERTYYTSTWPKEATTAIVFAWHFCSSIKCLQAAVENLRLFVGLRVVGGTHTQCRAL